MIKIHSISGSPRENVGKKDAKNLRKKGFIPCVIYGNGDQKFFYIEEKAANKFIFSPEVFIFEINITDHKHKAIIKEIQTHPVTDRVIHIDFLEISDDKPVTIKLPVKLTGNSIGVLKGGLLEKKQRLLTIKALPQYLPENITLDISKLDIGDTIKVKDILIDNLKILEDPSTLVVKVYNTRKVEEDTTQPQQTATTTNNTTEQ